MINKQNFKFIVIITILIVLMLILSNKVQAVVATVTTDTLNLRKEASTDSAVVKLLNLGDELNVISEEGSWYKVKCAENEGYVSKEFVKLKEELEENTAQNNAITNNNTNAPENSQTIPTVNNSNTEINTQSTIRVENDSDIRILPLINSCVLGKLDAGEEVEIVSKANNWYFIQNNEISGWIVVDTGNTIETNNNEQTNTENNNPEENNLEGNNPETNNENQNTNTASNENNYSSNVTKYVNESSIYVREEPSTSSNIVTTLIKNTDVIVTGENGEWYKIKYNNYNGYIRKDLLSDSKVETTNRSGSNIDRKEVDISESSDTEQNDNTHSDTSSSDLGKQIVEYAKQYLGCPYVYGGSGSSTFDCSGFTMYVYKHFGYTLSHSATAQAKNGTYVSKENLQPGDLVFFLDYQTMDGIGHCGIYIGDGNFIHASSGSGYCVKISTLLSGSYNNRYATARRLI